jgi:TPR repeat protein
MSVSENKFRVATPIAAMTILLSSCTGTTPERAYLDARAQIEHKRAGFETYRDPGSLLAYSASLARSDAEKQRYNRTLGSYFIDSGNTAEGYKALETAALAGDVNAGRKVMRAHYNGIFTPSDVQLAAEKIYLPATADEKDVSVRLLLARLVATRQVHGAEFKTSTYWLESAAALGSRDALTQLAENAEAAGRIDIAAAYYARFDTMPAKDRAMRQARDHYLGMERPANPTLGHAWLVRLAKLDRLLAAQLAARIYRQTKGSVDAAYLEATAAKGGITNLTGGSLSKSKVMEQYLAAKTDAEREKLIAPLRTAAAGGDAGAALTLARILLEVGGDRAQIFDLVNLAVTKGNADAMPVLVKLATMTDRGDANAPKVLAALRAAAEKGNVEAAKVLSTIYSIGGIADANQEESRAWMKRAADAGDVDAQYRIGVILWTTASTDAAREEAKSYVKRAADAGSVEAQTYLETAISPAESN